MNEKVLLARKLLSDYKDKDYTFGVGCLDSLGDYVKEFGNNILLIISKNEWAAPLREKVKKILNNRNINISAETATSRENSPKEDVFALADLIKNIRPDSIVCVGGGSAIDTAKAANILASLEDKEYDIDKYFGTGNVSMQMKKTGIKNLYPLIAVQVASGSGSHISRYSNVTDMQANQKKLIIDDAIIPAKAVFDYAVTLSMPESLTKDGALDGFSHCLEAYYGYDEKNNYFELVENVCLTGISLIVENLPNLIKNLNDIDAREKIGLATDLGGYAIMLQGTNGAHLNSYSFVDILPHGRACAILNPYYTVFFAPAIGNKLRKLAIIYKDYLKENIDSISDGELGQMVAKAMIAFSSFIGFPTKLSDVKGFTDKHIERAVSAAKDPQLESKLKNMPIPVSSETVDDFIRPVLEAAKDGDFNLVRFKS
jgi:alcohol dehydrogenase class IV